MYEEYEGKRIERRIQEENSFLWRILFQNYKELTSIKHMGCEHTELEVNLNILKCVVGDLSTFSYGKFFSHYVYKEIAEFSFQFIEGFSMMPDLNPADFIITKTVREITDVNEGDIVGGVDRVGGNQLIHKVVHKQQNLIITKGNSNKVQEVMSATTISEKVIMRIERETEMWNFLVKNPHLKQLCIESIDSTIKVEEKEDEKEIKYLKDLKRILEGREIIREDDRKFFRDKDGKVDKNAKKGFKS